MPIKSLNAMLNECTKHDFKWRHQWITETKIKTVIFHLSLAALRISDSKPSGEHYQKQACGVQPCGTTRMIERLGVAGTDWSSICHPRAQCLVGLAEVVNRWPKVIWMQHGDHAWILQTRLLSITTNWYERTFKPGWSMVKKSESRCNAHHQGSTALKSRYCISQ